MPANNPAIPYSPSFEQPEANEAEVTAKLHETMLGISKQTYKDSGHGKRGAHAKTHAIVHGELRIANDLPPELAQGLFAQTGTYPAVLRLSTAPGDILPDSVSTIRGLALKIIGVPGARLPGSEGDVTQDFLMVNGPTFQNKNAKSFLRDLKPFAAMTDKATWLKQLVAFMMRGLERTVEALGGKGNKLRLMGGQLPVHPLGENYFTQVPHLYGDYFGKLSLAPVSDSFTKHEGEEIAITNGDNPIRRAMSGHFAREGGTWELRVQLCTDSEAMPIEDAAKDWPQDQSPYRTIATVTVPPQVSWDDAATPALADRLSFSPWHGLLTHRPLGSIMRARKSVYEAISKFRHGKNGVPQQEPRSLSELYSPAQKAA